MNAALKDLQNMAWYQHEHDRIFHSDIYNMRPQDKVKHFVSHLTKYGCRLAIATRRGHDEEAVTKLLLDTFIICLSMANTFQINISTIPNFMVDLSAWEKDLPTNDKIRALTSHLRQQYNKADPMQDAIGVNQGDEIIYNIIAKMADASKAVEAWDHLEDYPFVANLKKLVPEYLEITLVALDYFGVNYLLSKYNKRMISVEKKNPFYEVLRKNLLSNVGGFQFAEPVPIVD